MPGLDIGVDEGIATIWLDQPGEKVNKLTLAMIEDFSDVLERLEQDDQIDGAVFASRKDDNFLAGADIGLLRSFEDPDEVREHVRRGQRLYDRLADLDKPVVAAVHGPCVGGGLELALACDYRIASDSKETRFSAAEVKLGLLPAFGGCQRLPRTVGLQAALPMLLTGKNVYAGPARKAGLADALIHRQGLVAAARRAARGLAEGEIEPAGKDRSLWRRAIEGTPLRRVVFDRAKDDVDERTYGNFPAPYKILDAVRTGLEDGFDAGLEAEVEHFATLLFTPEARALIHLFFAKRSAGRNPLENEVQSVGRVGVLGAGLMGAGIAQVTVESGRDVVLKDQTLELAAQGKGNVHKGLSKRIGQGVSEFERDRMVERVVMVDDWALFAAVDLTIEAVVEKLDVKRAVLGDADEHAGRETGGAHVFASNTSSLSVSDIAESVSRPESVVGMHYFSPVADMPLLEVVAGEKSASWAVATAIGLGLAQGKSVIRVADRPGFYVNRLLTPYIDEGIRLLHEGASVEAVDGAIAALGFPYGPLRLLDEVGIDIAAHVNDSLRELMSGRGRELSTGAGELLDAGWTGKKGGKGFYVYDGGERQNVNTDVYPFFGGDERRVVANSDIQERCLLVIVNEAAVALEEGIIESPTAGDVGAVFGFGFPAYLGGPFWYLDREGPGAVADRLEALAERHGERFAPASSLRAHASAGKRFHAASDGASTTA